jgi:hypothetical protein
LKEAKLLSSAAVLRALYDEKKDIYDVLSEFIKAIVNSKALLAFNSIECVRYIEEDFGFCMPEAIIRSCLRKRLIQTGLLSIKNGIYYVSEPFEFSSNIDTDFEISRKEYAEIIRRLYDYCSDNGLLDVNKRVLEEDFENYLTRPDKNNQHTNDIARFIVEYENELGFKDKLDKIEEGLILYTGIRYSPDLSTLGNWRGDLIIFLDAEHLFSATGLNGVLYKSLFDDFYDLVSDVNRNKKNGKITLRYLEETDSDIEAFFYAAQKIVERKGSIDPSKSAMLNICNGCKSESDVITKKADFLTKLSKLKIEKEVAKDYYAKPEFNVESDRILRGLSEDLKEFNVDTVEISSILKIFTKVNYLRQGMSNIGIDRVAAIFLTESWLPQRISFSHHVFEGNGAIPFATNIEFITEKLWFKLNKGFGGKSKKPTSFDPIIRAKLTISSQISRSVSNIYKSLSKQYNEGLIDEEVVARIYHEINKAPSKPDDVSVESISMAQQFLNENYIEKVINEKSLLERDAREGRQAKDELRQIRYQRRKELILPFKKSTKRQYGLLRFFTYIFLPTLFIFLIINSYTKNDTTLSIIFGVVGVISLITSVFRPRKIDDFYWSISKKWFRKSIKKTLQRTSH